MDKIPESGLSLLKRLGAVLGMGDMEAAAKASTDGRYERAYSMQDIAAMGMFIRMATDDLPCKLTITLKDEDAEYEYSIPENALVVLDHHACEVMITFEGPHGECGIGSPPATAKEFVEAFALGWNRIDTVGEDEARQAHSQLKADFARVMLRDLVTAILNNRKG